VAPACSSERMSDCAPDICSPAVVVGTPWAGVASAEGFGALTCAIFSPDGCELMRRLSHPPRMKKPLGLVAVGVCARTMPGWGLDVRAPGNYENRLHAVDSTPPREPLSTRFDTISHCGSPSRIARRSG